MAVGDNLINNLPGQGGLPFRTGNPVLDGFGADMQGNTRALRDGFVGTDQQQGLFGGGQYVATPHNIDQSAAQMPNGEMWRQMALQGMQSAGQRQAPGLGQASMYGGANINTGPQSQFRQYQSSLAQQLMDQATGKGPSLAQMQLQQGTDRNMQQAMALGASQRGMGGGAAMRDIGNQRAAVGQQMASDSGMLRLQEQNNAQALLGQVSSGARGQDLSLATNQAQLQQQAGLSNQNWQNQFAVQNQNAQLQQGAMNDQMVQMYLKAGMSVDQAQQTANMQMQQMMMQNHWKGQELNLQGYQGSGIGWNNALNIGKELMGGVNGAMGGVAKAMGIPI